MGSYLLYDIPGFLIHQRFMSMLKDQPLGFGAFASLFVLVGLGAVAEVDRVSKVDHVLKHIRHHVAGPVVGPLCIQPGMGCAEFRIGVHGWAVDVFFLKLLCDLGRSHSTGAHGEDAFDDSRRFLVHQQRRVFCCALAVAVGSSRPYPDSPLCLGIHHIPYLAAAVPHMPLVEQILEGHQFVAVFILGVHIVIDSDVAHIVGGEDLLNIKAGVKLVSAKAGEILRNDDSDVAVAHVIHHLLKGWAIEVCSGITIVS